MVCLNWKKIHTWVLLLFVAFSAALPFVRGITDPRDVYAISELYASLGFPPLLGWIPVGGDPCGPPSWQGVECVISNITAIKLNGANLAGELPVDFGLFASIILMSLNDNNLTGSIPDAFEQLTSLINMDLSGNNLRGELPSSMGNLSSLTTLHLQNNQLTGLLDVLQDLPLIDLNIENNLFSGPIPDKLLNIPTFRRTGNPFNTTILPSPPTSPPPLSPSDAHSPQSSHLLGPSLSLFPESPSKGVHQSVEGSMRKTTLLKQRSDHSIDMTRLDTNTESSPLPFPLLPAERVVSDPTFIIPLAQRGNASKVDSVKFYTIASLQQYTNSFSQENFVGKGMLGTVYKAQLPDGKVRYKVLAVKKLDKATSGHLSDREFFELVSSISKLKHPNIVELVGYCLEHGQRLLVYSYCRNGTLNEALHLDDQIQKKLSWNVRMRLALQAAKALEYLHEGCQPPIMHRNFKSTNVLLEDDLSVRVSDCGLAPLLSPGSLTQLQGSGYGAPELELGSYSYQSDVYSFGVVMLELLTGRKSHDRFRPRGEQYLVRWAFSRLHDIDALSRMVDPSLNGAYPSKSLSRVADIISLCIQPEPEFRPPMSEIVQKLESMIHRDR
ncbi:hypothetical protein RD792_002435 [Penstemon davidsonii]|uniref:Protein kinase domain-containing protein n=1 Tax=Penstemon davidsonii TaxID=160366 RepID=A0ABR0DR16_9LAMI|nr:hypothetical protein RD792_002435 [Penstemon davidsonii]